VVPRSKSGNVEFLDAGIVVVIEELVIVVLVVVVEVFVVVVVVVVVVEVEVVVESVVEAEEVVADDVFCVVELGVICVSEMLETCGGAALIVVFSFLVNSPVFIVTSTVGIVCAVVCLVVVVVMVVVVVVVLVVVVLGIVVVVVVVVVMVVAVVVLTGVVGSLMLAAVDDIVVTSGNASVSSDIFLSCGSVLVVVVRTDSMFDPSGSLRKHFSIFSWL